MMDWCYGFNSEDFIVPTDQEMLDILPTPDSLRQWGINGSQSFGWSRRFDPVNRADLPDEKNHQDPWCKNTMVHDHPDFQFSHLTSEEQMDDIFLSSLLKEDPSATEDNDAKSSRLSSETWLSSMLADDNLAGLMFDLESISSVVQNTGSSKNFKTNVESPSIEPEISHATTSSISNTTISCPNDHSTVKILHPSYQKHIHGGYGNNGSDCIGGLSLEETVLHDLEVTLTQLSNNTRLCFRDSFYRLAHNSIQQTSLQRQVRGHATDKPLEMEADDERISSGKTETAESKTNAIDRAVANLMFKEVDVNA